jgi:hypothetical protein
VTAPGQGEGRHYLVTFYVGSAMNRATLAAACRSDLTGREHTFTVAVAA